MSQLNVDSIKHSSGTGPGIDITSTGNVAIDTNTLFIDNVNDKVGIGTVTPNASLEIAGTGGLILNSTPLREKCRVIAGTANANSVIDVLLGNVVVCTTASTANWTVNVRGDASTTFDSLLNNGQVCVVTMLARLGGSSGYSTAFQIDGSAQSVFWMDGDSPSARGGTAGYDLYQYSIVKTATNTYTVFGTKSYMNN